MTVLRPIRVLVVDDSAFSRKTISRILTSSPLIEVVGTACDGEEALKKVVTLKPELITLDLEMPRMDGFTFLRLVMSQCPTPVIVISSRRGDQHVFKALELGAVDFVGKPAERPGPELEGIAHSLLSKVHGVRQYRIEKVLERRTIVPPSTPKPAVERRPNSVARVVAIGSSTGGPSALLQLFASFSDPLPCPVLVAQHMAEGFTEGFAERIDRMTPFSAREARGGELLEAGQVWVAPGGSHLELENAGRSVFTKVVSQTCADRFAPSVDHLFCSVAKHYGSNALGVILTGMGDDGSNGAQAIHEAGGRVFAESEETAVIFGMPQRAIRTGAVDSVLALGEIGPEIKRGVANGNGENANGEVRQ